MLYALTSIPDSCELSSDDPDKSNRVWRTDLLFRSNAFFSLLGVPLFGLPSSSLLLKKYPWDLYNWIMDPSDRLNGIKCALTMILDKVAHVKTDLLKES